MVDIEKLQAVYDKRLARLKDLRKRQEEKEWMTDKICDYLGKVINRTYKDSADIHNAVMEEHLKGEDFPTELSDEVMEVFELANEILMKRYDYIKY